MQKMTNRRYYDLEAGWLAERPMGSRLPRSQFEVYEYEKALGMSEPEAKLFANNVSSAGFGVTQEALDKAYALHNELVSLLAQRQRAVEERAIKASIRSPNTGNAIRSHKRRAAQKAARKKRK